MRNDQIHFRILLSIFIISVYTAVPTDLQSAPFGHSGIPPSVYLTIKDYTALSGKLQVFF